MYRLNSWTITIDLFDFSSTPVSFRDSGSYVPQDIVLFDGGIGFNLELGAVPSQMLSNADPEEVSRLANIHEKIASLPEGYDSNCGSSVDQSSGGKKYRVTIARASILKSRLLLLDETTSGLDAGSERAPKKGLENA